MFMKKRVIFYFDGFNFYAGLKDISTENRIWKNYYWIDLIKFCEQFVYEESEIVAVKYFTSPPMNKGKKSRQSAFLSANSIINPKKFIIINGHYQNKTVQCNADCKLTFQVPEEKRTDVSIAVNMLIDCFEDKVDTLILVSADSDQVPTIEQIKNKFPRKAIKIYFPPNRQSTEIYNMCNKT